MRSTSASILVLYKDSQVIGWCCLKSKKELTGNFFFYRATCSASIIDSNVKFFQPVGLKNGILNLM